MTTLAELKHVSKTFRAPVARQSVVKWMLHRSPPLPRVTVLNDISCDIRAGESVGIIGPNGSGKSTLLKLIAGVLCPTSGSISISGHVLPLFSWEGCFLDDLDLKDNLYLLGSLIGLSAQQIRNSRERITDTAGVGGRLSDQLRAFSPGMKARLALALANETSAQIVLLDETLSAGDSAFRASARELLHQWKAAGRAIMHVSHDAELIRDLSDRCLHLEGGHLRESE